MSKLVIEFDMSDPNTTLGELLDTVEDMVTAARAHIRPTHNFASLRAKTAPGAHYSVMMEVTPPEITSLVDGKVCGRLLFTDAAFDARAFSLTQRDAGGVNRGVFESRDHKKA